MEETGSLETQGSTGIRLLTTKFLKHGLLRPCRSLCNTPILPIRNSGEYRFAQALRAVNEAVVPAHPHPTVLDPYTIWTPVPETANWFAVLDLKDAFSSIPLHPDSQHLFAFEWTNPDNHIMPQMPPLCSIRVEGNHGLSGKD